MSNYDIQMKKKTGTIWERLFPITRSENVVHNDGKNTETVTKELNNKQVATDSTVKKIKTDISGIGNKSDYVSSLEKGAKIRETLEAKNQIRIATFNYRSGGNRIEYPNTYLLQAHELIEENGIHIVGMQEQGLLNHRNEEMYQSDMFPYVHFFTSFYPTNYPPRRFGNLTLSGLPFVYKDGGLINSTYDIEQRSYNRTVYLINGKQVAVYNIHLAHTAIEHRTEQINNLYQIISKDSMANKIILGDFNTRFASSFQIFLDNGWTHHNDNEFPTFKASGEGIDGILTSGGLTVKNKNIIRTPDELTDHNIFYVDIEVK